MNATPSPAHSERQPPLAPISARVWVAALVISIIGIRLETTKSVTRMWSPELQLHWLVFFALVALQPLLAKLIKLQKREIIAIFCFLLVACASFDIGVRFPVAYTAPQYFATPQDNMGMLFDEYVPDWFAPKHPEVIRLFYEGASDDAASLRPWLASYGLWITFFMVLWGTLFCIVALLRRYWVENERLAFPLVGVPLYIAAAGRGRLQPKRSMWVEPLMWVGAAISFTHLMSVMLHDVNPTLPTLGHSTDIGAIFTEHPLDALRPLFYFYHTPALTGFAYFAPQDLTFSMWFLWLLYDKPMRLIYRIGGFPEPSGWTYVQQYQAGAGAFVALAAIYAWVGRGYFIRVWEAVVTNRPIAGASDRHPWADPLSYRIALIGAVCGFAFLCLWYIMAGMTWWVAVGFFGLIILFATIFTRGRAESGLASLASFPYWQAKSQFTAWLGSDALAPKGNYSNLVLLGSLWFLHFGFLPEAMTYQIESLKMGEETRIKTSHMSVLIMIAMFVGLVVSFHTQLSLAHEWGMNTLAGGGAGGEGSYFVHQTRSEFGQVDSIVEGHHLGRDWSSIAYTLGGMVAALGLVALRMRCPASPLHPVGLIMTLPYGYAYWGPFFVAWLAKVVILRIGGGRLYHRMAPLFVGLVVGQVLTLTVVHPLLTLLPSPAWEKLPKPLR